MPIRRFFGIWVALLGGSAKEFGEIGLCKFMAAYEVYCEANGLESKSEEKSSYDGYLDLRDRLEPIIERNRDKIDAAKKKDRGG